MTAREPNDMTEAIIGGAIEVDRALGPGLLESVYEECLCMELADRGIAFERQAAVPVRYKGRPVEVGLRADLMVNQRVVVELKSVEKVLPIHEAQLLTCLRLCDCQIGLLINFNVPLLRDGITRRVNHYEGLRVSASPR